LIGALIGGFISYRGALAGARRTAKTAFDVQEKEFAHRDETAKLDEQNLIRGVVQAISEEIEALWRRYSAEIGPHLGDPTLQVAPHSRSINHISLFLMPTALWLAGSRGIQAFEVRF